MPHLVEFMWISERKMRKEGKNSRVRGRGARTGEGASVVLRDGVDGSAGERMSCVGSATVASALEVEAKEEGYSTARRDQWEHEMIL